MKETHEFEVKRKVFHMIFGVSIIAVMYLFKDMGQLFLLTFLAMCMVVSHLYNKIRLPIVRYFIEGFGRRAETDSFPGKGGILFLATALVLFTIMPIEYAAASVMILALGDTFANIVGRLFGKTYMPFSEEKKLEGTMAGINAATIGASIFVPVLMAFIASFIAMLVESVDTNWLDDNITVPLVAAIVLSLIRYLF